MIKAVIFDMFETLVTLSHAKRYMGEEISRDLNIDEPKFREIWNPSDYDRACGVRTFEDVVKEIMEVNDCYNKDLFDLVVRKRIESKEESFRCVRPDVYDMLEGLKKKGVKIALVSNSFFEEYDIIKNHPLYQYFDVTCISCVEGIKKPDERIFNLCPKFSFRLQRSGKVLVGSLLLKQENVLYTLPMKVTAMLTLSRLD